MLIINSARLRGSFTANLPATLTRTQYTFERHLASTPCSVLPQATAAPVQQLTALSPLIFTAFSTTPVSGTSTRIRAQGHAKKTLYFAFTLLINPLEGRTISLNLTLPLWARELTALKHHCEETGNIQRFLAAVGEYAHLASLRKKSFDKAREKYPHLLSAKRSGWGDSILRLRRAEVELTISWTLEHTDTAITSRTHAELRVPRTWKRGLSAREQKIDPLFVGLVGSRGWAAAVGCMVDLVFPSST